MPSNDPTLPPIEGSHNAEIWWKFQDSSLNQKRLKNANVELLLNHDSRTRTNSRERKSTTRSKYENKNVATLHRKNTLRRVISRESIHRRSRTFSSKRRSSGFHVPGPDLANPEDRLQECIEMIDFGKGEKRIKANQPGKPLRGVKRWLWRIWQRIMGKDGDRDYPSLRWPFSRKVRRKNAGIENRRSSPKSQKTANNTSNKQGDVALVPYVPRPFSERRQRSTTTIPDLVYKPNSKPVRSRRAPKILPTRSLPGKDKTGADCDPFSWRIFYEDPNVRLERAAKTKKLEDWRSESDRYLASKGRSQVNDECIGRAPPIPKRVLLKHRIAISNYEPRVTKTSKAVAEKGKNVRDNLSETDPLWSSHEGDDQATQISSGEVNHNKTKQSMLFRSKHRLHSVRPHSLPEIQSKPTESIIVPLPSIYGTSFSLPTDLTPRDDEGIDVGEVMIQLHKKLALTATARSAEDECHNAAADLAGKLESQLLQYRQTCESALLRAEEERTNIDNSPDTEAFPQFTGDDNTNKGSLDKDDPIDKKIFSSAANSRKPSTCTTRSLDTAGSDSGLEVCSNLSKCHSQSRKNSLKARFPVIPSPTIPSPSMPSTPSEVQESFPWATRTRSTTVRSGSSSHSTEPWPRTRSTTVMSASSNRSTETVSPSNFHRPLIRNFSIGRRMPEKSSGSEAVEIYFRLHQRVVSGGMRHSSPLMESPSQIALNRRRERKGLKPETNDESSHLTGDLSAGQISEELEDVDPIRRQGLANVESLEVGGDQCKLGKLGKLETPSRIQQAGARDKVYIDPSWKDAVEKAVEVPLVEHGEAPSEPSNKLLANQLAASPAVLAATAARAEERSRVHEPSKSRRLSDVSDQSIKTENNSDQSTFVTQVDTDSNTKKFLPRPYLLGASAPVDSHSLCTWPEEDDYRQQQQYTTPPRRAFSNPPRQAQFTPSKRFNTTTVSPTGSFENVSSHSLLRSTSTPSSASRGITSARGPSDGNQISQNSHQVAPLTVDPARVFLSTVLSSGVPLTPELKSAVEAEVKTEKKADLLAPVLPPVQPLIPELKVDVEAEEPPGRQVEFLSTVLESGQPLIPELRIALEAETKPRRQNVRFNLPPKQMEGRLQVRQPEMSLHKAKAVEDARQAQAAVNEMCRLAGRPPPIWALCELIGKGTYGRVYMGKNMSTAEVVAIKTIDIDESDQINPRHADSFTDWVKEVNALKSLKEINAKNVNHVIAAEPVGTVMWLVTEHCAGGSVQTLMKPTAPGGLLEKWIIPILREAAEGIKWVHQAGLIHRDIKCANVLIQEDGGVQLCDFGVAGVIEDRFDKRSTIVGTPHWMAPELLKSTSAYGKEVDIWAFGAMAFELATGLPPSVAKGHFHFEDVAEYLAHNVPRLEGGNFSDGLRNIVAYLLEELPEQRPKIEQVQQHSYIANTERQYPTSSLSQLVVAFKQWVDHGGTRKSLFQPGGAQRKEVDLTSDPAGIGNEDWNFSTTQAFDNRVSKHIDPRDVFEAYGENVVEFDTARPKVSRRRPPPQALAALPNPLVKVFDPNTVSNYYPNSKTYYGVAPEQYLSQGPPTSDLPLRDDSARMQIKDTMIDLGGHDMDTGLSSFPDMDTLKAGNPRIVEDDTYLTNNQDFHRPPLSDPADINPNRRTQDWKFPSFAPPASADPEISRFPPSSYELPRPGITPGVGGRPALIHHPTEPLGGAFGGGLSSNGPSMDRRSMAESLIDLDMSMPDSYPEIVRPSTANSEAGSATSEQMPSGNPFEFERHVSYQAPSNEYEPTLYVEDTRIDLGGSRSSLIDLDDARVSRINLDDAIVSRIDDDPRPPRFDYEKARESRIDLDEASIPRIDMDAAMTPPRDINDISDFSEVESGPNGPGSDPNEASRYDSHGFSDSDYISMPPSKGLNLNTIFTMSHFPVLPNPPSAAALAGTASREEMSDELSRSLGSMTAQLEAFRDVYESPAVTRSHSRRK